MTGSTPALPLRDKLRDTSPKRVTTLMGEVIALATASGTDEVHPADLDLAPDGRVVLSPGSPDAPDPVAAPEIVDTGPTPATLVFAAGAIGASVALGAVAQAPTEQVAHQQWLEDVLARLLEQWGDGADAQQAFEWIGRCLAFDRYARPGPNELLEALLPPPAPPARRPGYSLPVGDSLAGVSPPGSGGGEGAAPAAAAQQRAPWVPVALAVALSVLAFAVATCVLGGVVAPFLARPATPTEIDVGR